MSSVVPRDADTADPRTIPCEQCLGKVFLWLWTGSR